MIRSSRILLLAIAIALPASLAVAQGFRARSPRIQRAVDGVQPSVVKVFGAKGFRGVYGYMTGVIVHESGLVLTRGSVTLDEAHHISCHLHDGRRYEATIRRDDRRSRMILLKLAGKAGTKFPVAPIGDSEGVAAGDFVLLIGNAFRVAVGREECAVNLGMVSSIQKMKMRSGLNNFPYDGPVILHDAMNNPGVYGGPLVDIHGKVIGISGTLVESRSTNVQVHYAIPMNDLKEFISHTVNNPDAPRLYAPRRKQTEEEKKGPGFHGIRVLRGGFNRATEAYIDRVIPDSPAAKAGLRADDLIVKIDETPIRSWKTFTRTISQYRAGHTARLTIKRKKEIKLISLTLTERGDS
ncbi:MAG: trypsin-like peptidase domain-containing protein [Planctomycetota bacterium]